MHAPSCFSPETIQSLGWSLLHFLWQAAALALLFYVVVAFCRSASARYTAAVATLLLMACCPVATFTFLQYRSPAPIKDVIETVQSVASPSLTLPLQAAASLGTNIGTRIDWLSYCVILWLLGVSIFGVRAVGGWILVERLRREKLEPLAEVLRDRCIALQRRTGVFQRVRYFQSRLVNSPAVIGWFPPIVLLPLTALTGLSAQQLEAVIVHELAHIRRFDSFMNLFQIAIETVLFYHPAVWWVSRCIRAERENCCDDIAVSICENVTEYAKALAVMETWRATPALVMAVNSSSLKTRIARLIGFHTVARSSVPRAGLAAVGLLCAATALLASAAFKDTFPAPPAPAPPPSPRAVVPPAPENPPPAPPDIAEQDANPPEPAEPPDPPPQSPASGSYIDDLHSAGLTNFTVDQLIALKIQRVTPDFIRSMHDAGLTPNVDQLIAMRIHRVTPEYVRDLKAAGLHPSIDQLIAMRIQRVTPDYIRSMQSAGFGNLTIDQYISAKVQHITPEFIQNVRSHGFSNLTLDQLLALKSAHVF